ncbi:alpha/beta fold hydrolase [Streptomyces maoxianensis]|uniref:Alpha/beta fold hydrolase n=1 Tax=Streptomyces maoxianensis TaxID=1459942 RepID=A0ABV9GAV4_9ACTN
MRPRVVYVHGNGNKVRPELLKSQWDTALFGRDMAEASHMAYWAPLQYENPLPDFRPDPLDGGQMDIEESPEPVEFEAPGEFVARTLDEARSEAGDIAPESPEPTPGTGRIGDALGDWLSEMTYLADTLAESEETGVGPQIPLEALPLPRSARKAVFRTLVKHTFKDVHAYFFGGAGAAIRDVVREALDDLDGAPVAVVGHSLGSIVAYEVLAEQEREVELFVTVGSPLAITEVQDHLVKPPAVPAGVMAWRNASDLRDLVALDHTLRPEYAPTELVTDLLVTNDSRNHHGISQYLENPDVREPFQRMYNRLA